MPICPLCKTEYRPGFDTCADCHCPLIDSLPDELGPPPSLKSKVMDAAGQVVAVVGSSGFLVLLILVLAKASADEWRPWLTVSAPCVLLFALGWFLNDWLSPVLVWICWSVVGFVVLVTGNLREYPMPGGLAIALAAIPAAMALPVICGVYFGKTKKLYLFFVPLLAYAVLFWIMTGIKTTA